MSILVTGAAGFIGSHVVERLLADGEEVVGLDVYDEFYSPAIKERNLARARDHRGFTEVRADIRDRAALDRLPASISAVVHLAARAGVRPSIADPVLYSDVNVTGTTAILDWMQRRRLRALAFASSSSVYGNRTRVPFSEADPVEAPYSPYAATKRAGELLCRTFHELYGLSVVSLRFFTAYGERQRPDLAIHRFAQLMRDGKPIPVFGDGTTERDYTYIADIVDGVARSLDHVRRNEGTCEIVNLGESRTIALTRMIQVLSDAMGVTPVREYLPEQPGDVRRTFADVSKAARLFGYAPQTPFEDGIRRFVAWFREQPVH